MSIQDDQNENAREKHNQVREGDCVNQQKKIPELTISEKTPQMQGSVETEIQTTENPSQELSTVPTEIPQIKESVETEIQTTENLSTPPTETPLVQASVEVEIQTTENLSTTKLQENEVLKTHENQSREIISAQENYHGSPHSITDHISPKRENEACHALNQPKKKIPISGSHAPASDDHSHLMSNRGEIRLPNGIQNEFYKIDLKTLPQFLDLETFNLHTDSQNTGLILCPETYVLQGVISNQAVDDCQLLFYGKDLEGRRVKITALILVNPDPKTLWKQVEPNSPYFRKSHQHFQSVTAQYGRLTAARTRGRSHAMRGAFCEDDFSIAQSDRLGYFGMVSDGAGSSRFSRLGSKLLTESLPRFLISSIDEQLQESSGTFKRWLTLFSETEEAQKHALDAMKEIFTYALRQSLYVLHQHTLISVQDEESQEQHCIRLRDLYSTCLAFWAYPLADSKRWAVASFWVGDGALALSHGGKFSLLGVPDGGEFSGQTRFFTDEELTPSALEKRLKVNIYDDLDSIWAFSDGVTDPKFLNEKQLQENTIWQSLTAEIKPHLVDEKSLLEWLEFWSPGEHDDRSLCVLEVKGK